MIEVIFLIVLGIIWTVFASIQDLRKREVNNWLNFSLVIFGLGFKFFYSLFEWNFSFFYWGITFFVVFFVLSNFFITLVYLQEEMLN
jgi:Flp pilus assembly protein protease CpaA